MVLTHGDWSVTEHASVTVDAEVDTKVATEWTRHRLGAYTQESTRFVDYTKGEDGFRVIMPKDLEGKEEAQRIWRNSMLCAEATYSNLRVAGSSPQEARAVLPHCTACRLVVTYNLRNWRHFFLMRTTREAHPQIREVASALLGKFKELIPLLYDDIEPGQRQADNLRKPR